MRKLLTVAALFASLHGAPGGAATPGLWEYRSFAEIPGLDPQMAAASPLGQLTGKRIFRACVGVDGVPAQPPGTGQCAVSDVRSDGTTVTWHVSCQTPQGEAAGNGKAIYAGDSVKARMDMQGDMGGFPIAIIIHTSGSFSGACAR